MSTVAINVCRFFSCESFLKKKIYETQGFNYLHNDFIQCYAQLAEGMGWEHVYGELVKAADGTVENQEILNSAKQHLNALRQARAADTLPN